MRAYQFDGDEPAGFIQKPYEALTLLEQIGAIVAAGSAGAAAP